MPRRRRRPSAAPSPAPFTGGWSFVWLAYAASTSIFLVYAASLHRRYRDELKRARRARRDANGGPTP